MRVLQINSVCGIGSTGKIATDIHHILKVNGHESYIAYGRGDAYNCDESIKIGTKFDNYLHVAKTRISDRHGLGSRSATLEFLKQIEELNPDVIHLHNLHGYYINIEVLLNYLDFIQKPIVWTLHDCWLFTGHCSHFESIGCYKWKNICYNCPQKKEYPASLFLDNSKVNYEQKKSLLNGMENIRFVSPSKWLKDQINASFLSRNDTIIINNGIDLTQFKPCNSNFRGKYGLDKSFVILGVANIWTEKKGLQYFLELSKIISDDYRIVLVGLSKKQISEMPHNIIGITKTNNIKELAEIYSAADVFVNTTQEEVLGLVNVEALACGTPVVTFNSGGSPECIDASCGYTVTKGDIQELMQKINRVKVNTKSTYTEFCVTRAKKAFNKNDKYMEYISLYNDIIK